ncbi:hypothetical protein [Streptomyces sp. MMG1121]|nr:hypothetical protein [Streptomyces sp. MMG1121]
MAPETAVAMVQKITNRDYADDAEAGGILEALDVPLPVPADM